ncbi:MAG: hypothetical protein J3K34DRAFT_469138 [Monoraphidium minutum]|nr:MAG: hypothetical protein J3K34DRAFT_469138 [Monoraphidium minutum]
MESSGGGDPRLELLASELHAAMAPVLQGGAADPLLHLAAHFAEQVHGAPPAAAAHRRLRLCAPDAPAFGGRLFEAFSILSGGGDCVPPDAFLAFVGLLTAGLRPHLAVQLQRLCSDLARLAVDYSTYQAAARACLLVEQLASPEACGGRSFVVAEARELLSELVERQEWAASIEVPPLHSVSALKAVPVPEGSGLGLDGAVEAEARAAAVDRLLAAAGAACAV